MDAVNGCSYEKSAIFPGLQKAGWLSAPCILSLPDKTFLFIQQSNGIEQIVKWTEALEQLQLCLTYHHCFHKLQFCKILWIVLNSCNSDMSYGHWGNSGDKVVSEQKVMEEKTNKLWIRLHREMFHQSNVCKQEQGSHTPRALWRYNEHTDTLLQGSGTWEDFSRDHHWKDFKYTV